MLRPLPLSLSFLLATTTMAQIPNGGFESWSDASGTNEPTGWITLNDVSTMFGVELATQGMPGAVGASHLRLTTAEVEELGVLASMAFIGAVTDDDVLDGFPFAQRPEALTGQMKYAPVGNDVGSIYVALTRWDASSGSRMPVAGGTLFVESNAPNWTVFSIPLDYMDESMPDTASITILSSSGADAASGTVFSIDDLQFTGISTSVSDAMNGRSAPTLFPNPATDLVLLQTPQAASRVEVFSADGRCVLNLRANSDRTTLPIGALAPGTYVVRATFEDGPQQSTRLLKQ